MAEFESACRKINIALYALPPKQPNLDRCVERTSATVRYEFYPIYHGRLSVSSVNRQLEIYRHQYNRYRPHKTLDRMIPMEH